MLGVLITAGAAICLAPCGSALPSGTWARPLTQSPELGFGFCLFSSWNGFDFCFVFIVLRGCRHCRLAAVVQWFVHFSAYPKMMQQHRQLSCGGDDRSLLPALSATFGQLQTPASQVTVDAKRSQDVLRPLHQQCSQIGVSFFADVHLRLLLCQRFDSFVVLADALAQLSDG